MTVDVAKDQVAARQGAFRIEVKSKECGEGNNKLRRRGNDYT
jgi:uncharacterized protein (DUF736 family)